MSLQQQVNIINKRLQKIAKGVPIKTRRRIYGKAARKISKAARENVNSRSGKLRKNITRLRLALRQDAVYVGVKKRSNKDQNPFYAHFVEYGTENQKPQGYMRRAYESKKEEVRQEVIAGLSKEYNNSIKRVSQR